MEKIGWTGRVRNEVLNAVQMAQNILHTINTKKGNWFGHILCRNCLPIHVLRER